jgi:hypothetical protein
MGRGKSYDYLKFAEIWNSSDSIQEIMEKTGLEYGVCRGRASKVRASSIALKRFQRGRKKGVTNGK